MSLQRLAVVVVSKFPEPGRVKTRLQPALTANEAAAAHRMFLLHLVRRLHDLKPAELILYYDDPRPATTFPALLHPICKATFVPQCAGDLGARLASCAALLAPRFERILFFGCDSPDLPASHLHRAAELTTAHDVTLGRTDDGGYWCLGLSSRIDASRLLAGIEWSSGREADQTLAHAAALGYTTAVADEWDDVDRPADLRRLLDRLARSRDPDDRMLLTALRDVVPAADPWPLPSPDPISPAGAPA